MYVPGIPVAVMTATYGIIVMLSSILEICTLTGTHLLPFLVIIIKKLIQVFLVLVISYMFYILVFYIMYFPGDSGYALRPWMLTPIQNAVPGSPEDQYNTQQTSTRSLIERCNGILKLRFRCLLKHRVLHYDPTTASKIINSCVILHNLCIHNNIPLVQFGDDEEDRFINIDYGIYDQNARNENNERNHRNEDLLAGRRLQQLIIVNYFRGN